MRLDVQIPAADGVSPGTLHVPDGACPSPGVLVFPAVGGVRETMAQMGDRLAGAQDDGSCTAEQAALLDGAVTEAGVDHTVEFYPARHGFAVPDTPSYDAAASARHWDALRDLYRSRLQPR